MACGAIAICVSFRLRLDRSDFDDSRPTPPPGATIGHRPLGVRATLLQDFCVLHACPSQSVAPVRLQPSAL
eukprot:3959092-Prymnesium_polylepis.1